MATPRRPILMLPLSRRAAIVVASLIALLTTACGAGDPGPVAPSTATDTPEAIGFQYQPWEADVRFTPQPDGALQVTQTVILDAGPGISGSVVTYVKKQLRISTSADPDGWRYVTPTIGDVTARDITATDDPQELPASIQDQDGLWRLVAAEKHEFPAGRHRIELAYTVSGLLTSMDDRTVLIVPQGTVDVGWYSNDGIGDIARFSAAGGAELGCGDEDQGISKPTCQNVADATVVRMSGLDNGGTVYSGANGYFFLTDPAGVTAAPAEAQFLVRS